MQLRTSGLAEQDGLAERRGDGSDARVSNVGLTAAGLRTLRAARRTHHEIIRRRFLGYLSADEMRHLDRLRRTMLADAPAA